VVSTARRRLRGELSCFVTTYHGACLDGFICLDGNRLYFKCAALPPAALLHIGAGIFSRCRCAWLVGRQYRVRRAAFSQQHRWDYPQRRVAIIRAGNHLEKKTLNPLQQRSRCERWPHPIAAGEDRQVRVDTSRWVAIEWVSCRGRSLPNLQYEKLPFRQRSFDRPN